jgi:hypothetical protein
MIKFQAKVFWAVMLCSVVVGYQHLRGPRCLHLQGEMTRMEKNGIDTGPEGRGLQVPLANRKQGGSDLAGSAISMMREH